MGCGCGKALGNSIGLEAAECGQISVIGDETTNYLPYILAALGTLAFIGILMSDKKKGKSLKAPAKTR